MVAPGEILTLVCLRMQRIFSARLDEAVLDEMDRVTRRLGISKRQFLEEAIQLRAQESKAREDDDVWAETLGAWSRSESPQATVRRARHAFRKTFDRRRRKVDARVRR